MESVAAVFAPLLSSGAAFFFPVFVPCAPVFFAEEPPADFDFLELDEAEVSFCCLPPDFFVSFPAAGFFFVAAAFFVEDFFFEAEDFDLERLFFDVAGSDTSGGCVASSES